MVIPDQIAVRWLPCSHSSIGPASGGLAGWRRGGRVVRLVWLLRADAAARGGRGCPVLRSGRGGTENGIGDGTVMICYFQKSFEKKLPTACAALPIACSVVATPSATSLVTVSAVFSAQC